MSRCCLLPFGRVRVASRRYIGAIDLGSALVPVENDTFVLEHAKEERSRIPQRFILIAVRGSAQPVYDFVASCVLYDGRIRGWTERLVTTSISSDGGGVFKCGGDVAGVSSR